MATSGIDGEVTVRAQLERVGDPTRTPGRQVTLHSSHADRMPEIPDYSTWEVSLRRESARGRLPSLDDGQLAAARKTSRHPSVSGGLLEVAVLATEGRVLLH